MITLKCVCSQLRERRWGCRIRLGTFPDPPSPRTHQSWSRNRERNPRCQRVVCAMRTWWTGRVCRTNSTKSSGSWFWWLRGRFQRNEEQNHQWRLEEGRHVLQVFEIVALVWFLQCSKICIYKVNTKRHLIRGGAKGAFAHTHPSINCYVLDILEFLHFICKSISILELFRQKCWAAPPPPHPSQTNFWIRQCT